MRQNNRLVDGQAGNLLHFSRFSCNCALPAVRTVHTRRDRQSAKTSKGNIIFIIEAPGKIHETSISIIKSIDLNFPLIKCDKTKLRMISAVSLSATPDQREITVLLYYVTVIGCSFLFTVTCIYHYQLYLNL